MTELPGFDAYAKQYLTEARDALDAPYIVEGLRHAIPLLVQARAARRTVFLCGNGGSSSAASHFVTDLSKVAARGDGPKIRAVGLTDNTPSVTAIANDVEYARIFADQLTILGQSGDVLIAISGSGNSPNVLEAVKVARSLGMTTIGLTGIGGGQLKGMADVAIVVPSNSMQHVEDVHVSILHLVTAYLRDAGPVSTK
jgi:D-sedoheptulose 7-phosphate isomerase